MIFHQTPLFDDHWILIDVNPCIKGLLAFNCGPIVPCLLSITSNCAMSMFVFYHMINHAWAHSFRANCAWRCGKKSNLFQTSRHLKLLV